MGKRGRPPHPDILTPREWEVLALLRERLTNREIAERLGVTLHAARYHVSEIISKLGVETREEAAAWRPEPEPVTEPRRRWWVPLLAWLRPLTLAKAAGIAVSVAAVAGLGVLAWGVLRTTAGSESGDGSAVNVSTPSATPIPGDTVFEPLTIADPDGTKLLFTRGQVGLYEPGALWMSNLDGSDLEALIDESTVSEVIRVVRHWQTGNPTIYYTLRELLPQSSPPTVPRGRQTVSTLDLVTGQRAELLAFEIEGNQAEAAADVTDDGGLIAYTNVRGLAIFDTSSGQTRRVLDSNVEPCLSQRGETLEGCSTFLGPSWSPDDSLLAMTQVSGDSSEVLVVDASADPPPITTVEYAGLYPFKWSPSGKTLCAVSPGDFYPIGLIVARAPDWRANAFLTDYQSELLRTPHLPDPDFGGRGMWGCVWLDESTVAVMHDVFIQSGVRRKEILVVDLETSAVSSLREHNEFTSSRNILPVPGRNLLISQFHRFEEYPDAIGDLTTPEVVDSETGARAPILTTEDRIVVAVPAELLTP
jgi:DNA-binding CsgD family transcriptional regulator